MFQTLTSISEKVDPVKLNLTLSAAAQALTGLGDKFGQSIVNANAILDDVNPQMPQARHDIQQLAALGDIYANAAPDLLDFLNNSVITARSINAQQKDLDQALLAAAGFGNTGADIFERGGPYLARGAADLVPTAAVAGHLQPGAVLHPAQLPRHRAQGAYVPGRQRLLAEYPLPRYFPHWECFEPDFAGAVAARQVGGLAGVVGGAPNPYMYPENLPRVNARGGPGGAPGLLAGDHPSTLCRRRSW